MASLTYSVFTCVLCVCVRCYAQIARCHGQLQQGMHVESGLPQYVSAVRPRYNVRTHMYSIYVDAASRSKVITNDEHYFLRTICAWFFVRFWVCVVLHFVLFVVVVKP